MCAAVGSGAVERLSGALRSTRSPARGSCPLSRDLQPTFVLFRVRNSRGVVLTSLQRSQQRALSSCDRPHALSPRQHRLRQAPQRGRQDQPRDHPLPHALPRPRDLPVPTPRPDAAAVPSQATPPTENRDNVNGQSGYPTHKGASTPSLRRSSRRARKSSSTAGEVHQRRCVRSVRSRQLHGPAGTSGCRGARSPKSSARG
jgi:hypothetical protein